MIKTISSKTAWLLALAISFLGLAALVVWAQVAQAQTSNVVSVSVSQAYGEDSGGSDITVTLRASGSNDFVPFSDGTGNYGMYDVKTVDAKADCSEDDFGDAIDFGVSDDRFEVKRTRDTSYTRSRVSQTFTTGAAVVDDDILVRAGDAGVHDDRYICVKATYSDGDDDIEEYAVSSVTLDTASPMVDRVLVNKDARNQEYGQDEDIDIAVEFDERVYVRKITDSSGDDVARPYIMSALGENKHAELRSTASGTTLTFRYTVGFADTNGDIGDLSEFTIVLPDGDDTEDTAADYVITDAAGNNLVVSDPIDEEIDFRGSEILVELMVEAVRMGGDRLVVKATPMKYGDNDALTVAGAIAYSSEDRPDVRSNEDPCLDGVIETGGTYDAVADKPADSDYFGTDLPDDPDNEYYCFAVTDAVNHPVVYTNVYRYVEDTTAPRIAFNRDGNEITIVASDSQSGIKSAGLNWFWMEGANASCSRTTNESLFNETADTIGLQSGDRGLRICARAENNAGLKKTMRSSSLSYDVDVMMEEDDEEEEEEEEDDDDTVVDPGDAEDVDDGDDDGDDDMESTEGKTKVPKAWPGQAAWDQAVTDGRAGVVNPWGCVDDTKIGRERGMCLSGGTTLMDDDYVYVDGYDDAGDGSSATPAPGSDDTSTTTTPPGTTTIAPDPGDAGDPGTDDGSTDDGSTDSGDATVAEGASSDVISLTYSYDDASDMVKVSLDESVTATAQYVVQEDGNSCDETGVDTATAQDVGADDDGDLVIQVDEAAVEAGHYVCVFVAMTDADGNEDMDYQVQQVGEDATAGTDDGASGDGDDEGGSNSLWIIIAIVGILIVGVVVVLLFSGKRNS